jgi:hypothetical protein
MDDLARGKGRTHLLETRNKVGAAKSVAKLCDGNSGADVRQKQQGASRSPRLAVKKVNRDFSVPYSLLLYFLPKR